MASNKIIINADDFGYNATVNRAIIKSFQRGLISSSSLMANMPGFEDAIGLVREHRNEDDGRFADNHHSERWRL